MRLQAGQDVMGVLPDGLGDDDGRVRIDAREDVHAHALVGDEAMADRGVVVVGAPGHV